MSTAAQLIAAIGGAVAGILGPVVTLIIATRTSKKAADVAVATATAVDRDQNRELEDLKRKIAELDSARQQQSLGQIANPPPGGGSPT